MLNKGMTAIRVSLLALSFAQVAAYAGVGMHAPDVTNPTLVKQRAAADG